MRILSIALVVLALGFSACSGPSTGPTPTPTPTPNPVPTPQPQPGQTTTMGGQTTDASTSQPFSGVLVEVVGSNLRATSGSDGKWQISGITATTFTLRWSKDGYQTFEKEQRVRLGETHLDLDLAMQPIKHTTMGGRVNDASTGQPLSGVLAEVVGSNLRATSGSDGKWQISGITATTFTLRWSKDGYQTFEKEQRVGLGETHLNLDLALSRGMDPTNPSISIWEVLPASPAGPLPRGDFNTVRLLIHYEQNNWPGADRLTAWACEADDRPGMFIRTTCQANSVSKSAPDLYLNPTLGIRGTSDCGITKITRIVVFLTPTNEALQTPSPTDPYKSESGLTIWARAESAVNWTYQPCN